MTYTKRSECLHRNNVVELGTKFFPDLFLSRPERIENKTEDNILLVFKVLVLQCLKIKSQNWREYRICYVLLHVQVA